MKTPLVSLIIVNWNGEKYLRSCLKSLAKISYKNTEIIVIDQNSTDKSLAMVKKYFPMVHVILNKENTGYVGGNNLGVSRAKGKYAMILNNDIEVDKHFLEPLVSALEQDSHLACVQPKAINIRHKGKLDGGGSFLTWTGFLYHKGYLESAQKKEFNLPYYVYSVKGAYMFFRRELFLKIGGLDKDFFIYFEESDFCGRLWVEGYQIKYLPSSIVYHWGGGDTKEDWNDRFALIQYRSFRNRVCSYIKNLSVIYLSIILPIHLFLLKAVALYYLLTGGWKVTIAIEKAILWNILHLGETVKKRQKIQSKRKVTDSDIFKIVGQKVSLGYYFHQLQLLSKD